MRRAQQAEKMKDRPLPIGVAIAHFMWVYGGTTFVGPWPTRDRVIPWQMFWHLYGAIPHVMALKRVNESQAMALGQALATGSESASLMAHREADTAYPTE